MSFRFRLQRVLGVRESFEKMRAIELARAAAARDTAAAERDAAEQRLDARRDASTLAAGQTLTAGMLHNLELTVHAADTEVEAAEKALDAASAEAAQSTERYTDARRGRRVLERLRDERQHAWQEDEDRRDRRAMDEIAQAHTLRREDKRAA